MEAIVFESSLCSNGVIILCPCSQTSVTVPLTVDTACDLLKLFNNVKSDYLSNSDLEFRAVVPAKRRTRF